MQVTDPADQLELDKLELGKYKFKNKGCYWILTAVQILSRFAFAILVYKNDTENMTHVASTLLEQFRDRFGRYPSKVQFDDGKESYNVGVKSLLEKTR